MAFYFLSSSLLIKDSHHGSYLQTIILQVNDEKVVVAKQAAGLAGELNRMSSENKKLTEMLAHLFEDYHALQTHLMGQMGLANNNSQKEFTNSRKRKAESDYYGNLMGINGNTECSSSDEDSCKRPKENTIKTKASRVCVRTDASDKSLVSS